MKTEVSFLGVGCLDTSPQDSPEMNKKLLAEEKTNVIFNLKHCSLKFDE